MITPGVPWDQAYHDVWCPSGLYATDPGACTAGLVLGYVWVPSLVLLAFATLVHVINKACQDEEEEEETPRDLHRRRP